MKTLLSLAALALVHAGPAAAFLPGLRRTLLPRLAGTTAPGHVALTLDDGPAPASTPQFLRVLAEHDVRATFFVLGAEARKAPWLITEIAAAGHETGVHGRDHRCLLRKTPARTHWELCATRDLIEHLTGTRPRWFRPPYGVFSTASLVSARRLGLRPILWSTWDSTGPKAAPPPPVSAASGDRAAAATPLPRNSLTTWPIRQPTGAATKPPPYVPVVRFIRSAPRSRAYGQFRIESS